MSNIAPSRRNDLDIYQPSALLDPYPHYARLRDLGPVVFEPEHGIWLVPGYAEADAVLRNHREFVSGDGVTYAGPGDRIERYPLIENDPPEHTRIRRAMQPSFTKSQIEELRPGVQTAAETIADEAMALGEFDAVKVVAQAMPDRGMHVLTGLTTPNGPQVADWADAVSRGDEPGGTPRHNELIGDAVKWMIEEGVPGLPAHCLGRTIMESGGINGGLDAEGPERLMTLASIWMAGIDSTTSLLGNAIDAFIEHPDQWELLRERPDLIPNAVEELIRYEAPFRIFYRRTRAEADIGGTEVPAGAVVCVILASTGRDSRHFSNPDQLDVTRHNARTHLAFGTGIHLCLGAPFLRLEVSCMLAELALRVRRFERTGEALRHPSQTMRKFESLPVRLVLEPGSA